MRLSSKARALAPRALENYAELAFAVYSDSVRGARTLATAVEQLVAAPSAERLQIARSAWVSAREPYAQSEVFRFYDGPIDRVEAQLNSWPIDESYVEAGLHGKRPGIIENEAEFPALSASVLAAANAKEGETSVSSGYHVVEFLLWGSDTHADGPGDRPYTDYAVDGASGDSDRARVATRRGQYLRVASAQLVELLEQVRAEWAPNRADNYRGKFLRLSPEQALARAVKGMGSLSGPELAGERLTVAYATKDQENEQSCFSDTTQTDLVNDAIGIENVCLGRYQGGDGNMLRGTGLCALIAAQAPSLAASLEQRLRASVAAARAVPSPFDQAILGSDSAPGRQAVEAAMAALRHQAETLSQVAALLGLKLSQSEETSSPGKR